MRRILALFTALFVLTYSIAAPATMTLEEMYRASGIERMPSRLPQVATKAGGLIGLSRAALGGPIGLAVGIGLAYVQYQADEANALRVQLGQKNGNSLPVPSGFKDEYTPLDYATTPGTLYQFTYAGSNHTGYRSITEAGVAACGMYQDPTNGTYTITGFASVSMSGSTTGSPMCSAIYKPNGQSVVLSTGISLNGYSAPTCQDGYGVNAQSRCAPITSEKQHWPVDGQPTIRPSANGGWENHPTESDTLSGLSNSNPTININGVDANGNPTLHTVTANPDGSVTVNIKTEIPNQTGGKDVDNLQFTTNTYGDVVSVTNSTYQNTTINQVSPVPATNPQNPQPVDLKLPSDYARENTQQSIKSSVDQLHTDLTHQPTIPTTQAASWWQSSYPNGLSSVWQSTTADAGDNQLIVWLQGWSMPDGGTCPTWTIPVNLGAMGNYGVVDVSPPCWIWPVIKAFFIVSAIFVSRRLVFGG